MLPCCHVKIHALSHGCHVAMLLPLRSVHFWKSWRSGPWCSTVDLGHCFDIMRRFLWRRIDLSLCFASWTKPLPVVSTRLPTLGNNQSEPIIYIIVSDFKIRTITPPLNHLRVNMSQFMIHQPLINHCQPSCTLSSQDHQPSDSHHAHFSATPQVPCVLLVPVLHLRAPGMGSWINQRRWGH